MANSTYPVPIGRAGSGSSKRLLDAHEKGRIHHTMSLLEEWRCEFDITLAGALSAATTQSFDLHTYLGSNPSLGVLFPADVVRESPAKLYVRALAVGATTTSVDIGDANDANGLMTSYSVHTGGTTWAPSTPAAAEYAPRYESAFIPELRVITTVEDVDAITAFRCLILIPFRKVSDMV